MALFDERYVCIIHLWMWQAAMIFEPNRSMEDEYIDDRDC